MSRLPLRTPSFRSRLRLFFVVIVVVPMITMAVVLFQLIVASERSQTDARLAQSQTVSQEILRELEAEAGDVAQLIGQRSAAGGRGRDVGQTGDPAAARHAGQAGRGALRPAPARRRGAASSPAPFRPSRRSTRRLVDEQRAADGRLVVAMLSPEQYANRIAKLTGADVVIEQGDSRLASTSADAPSDLPEDGAAAIDGTDYRVTSFEAPAIGGEVTVRLLLPDQDTADPTAAPRSSRPAAFVGFLVLAFIFAVAVSRRLQSEIQRLLVAAQRLGSGDFSVEVPAEGNDEFAALGKEFNSMARQLEARLEELQRERERLQDAIRRVGESFAAGLDRVGLLEIVVQTAVDGIGAAAGRATMRDAEEQPEGGRAARASRRLPARAARRRGGGHRRRPDRRDPGRRRQRARRAARRHRGRRPGDRHRLRGAWRPWSSPPAPSSSGSATSPTASARAARC